MTTVREIQSAIKQLPNEKLAKLRRWFEEFDAARWDQQFETDVRGGKLDKLAEQARGELRAGRCSDL